MPTSLDIAFFVFGAILLFLALLGGRFKLFGAEVSAKTTNKPVRIVAFLLGIILISIPTYVYLNPTSDTESTSDSQITRDYQSENDSQSTQGQQSENDPQTTTDSEPETNNTQGNNTEELSGCIITIENSLVPLMNKPDTFSNEIITVEENPIGTQGWFKISVNSREGWIKNDTWTISSKSAECP